MRHDNEPLAHAAWRAPGLAWLVGPVLLSVPALWPLAARSARGAPGHVAAQLAAVVVLQLLSGLALRAMRLAPPVVAIFLAGIALRFAYLYVTPYSLRSHDADQHIAYVEYIVTRHLIPAPSTGWAFYHPPFYFVLSALVWRVLAAVGVPRPSLLVGLQVQSLLFQLGFLVFALLTARRWLDRLPDARLGDGPARTRDRLGLLFAVLMCFWPSGVLHSVRVGNDDLFYLFFGGALLFVTRWWQDRRNRDLHVAALFAALATLAKSNGVLVFVLLGALFVARVLLDERRSLRAYLRQAWPTIALACVSAGTTVARSALDIAARKKGHMLIGNADQLPHALAVGNGAANYLWFDVKMFVTQPYSSSWVDDAGRQYFWNFALKTGLLGDFQYDGAWLSNLAVIMSALLLPILACVATGALRQSKADWMAELPLTVAIAVAIPALAALRMSIPMACSNDFRYVWPILMPSLYLYVRAVARLRESGRLGLARFGEGAGWSFAGCSIVFFSLLAAHG
jgi:hypothetical protein